MPTGISGLDARGRSEWVASIFAAVHAGELIMYRLELRNGTGDAAGAQHLERAGDHDAPALFRQTDWCRSVQPFRDAPFGRQSVLIHGLSQSRSWLKV